MLSTPRETIPWDIVAAHERQVLINHDCQTLQQLSRRGGLSWSELVAILLDRPQLPINEVVARRMVVQFCHNNVSRNPDY